MFNTGFLYLFYCISFLFAPLKLSALVNCTPSNCTPACNKSCTYYACDGENTHSFSTNTLKVTGDIEPSDACQHSAVNHQTMPFTIDSTTYDVIPATITHKYKICKKHTKNGPPC